MLGKIFLEITNRCNLSCSFCPPTRRKGAFLSLEDFELFLGRLEGVGDHLYFHVKGEPLLHPALDEFLGLAAARGFAVTLTTNGTLVAQRAAELLGAANIRKLSLSLHSHSGSGEVDAYWRGVEAFLDLHRLTPTFPVSLRLWNLAGRSASPGGRKALGQHQLALSRGFRPRLSPDRPEGHRARLSRLPERGRALRLAGPRAPRRTETRGFCYGLRNQVGILVDGTVVPCCLDGEGVMGLGSLRDASLQAILDSPRARAIREGFAHRSLVEPLCRTCGYRRRFSKAQELAGA